MPKVPLPGASGRLPSVWISLWRFNELFLLSLLLSSSSLAAAAAAAVVAAGSSYCYEIVSRPCLHAHSQGVDARRSHWFLHILRSLWFLKEIPFTSLITQYLQPTLNHLQSGNVRTFFFFPGGGGGDGSGGGWRVLGVKFG